MRDASRPEIFTTVYYLPRPQKAQCSCNLRTWEKGVFCGAVQTRLVGAPWVYRLVTSWNAKCLYRLGINYPLHVHSRPGVRPFTPGRSDRNMHHAPSRIPQINTSKLSALYLCSFSDLISSIHLETPCSSIWLIAAFTPIAPTRQDVSYSTSGRVMPLASISKDIC